MEQSTSVSTYRFLFVTVFNENQDSSRLFETFFYATNHTHFGTPSFQN